MQEHVRSCRVVLRALGCSRAAVQHTSQRGRIHSSGLCAANHDVTRQSSPKSPVFRRVGRRHFGDAACLSAGGGWHILYTVQSCIISTLYTTSATCPLDDARGPSVGCRARGNFHPGAGPRSTWRAASCHDPAMQCLAVATIH